MTSLFASPTFPHVLTVWIAKFNFWASMRWTEINIHQSMYKEMLLRAGFSILYRNATSPILFGNNLLKQELFFLMYIYRYICRILPLCKVLLKSINPCLRTCSYVSLIFWSHDFCKNATFRNRSPRMVYCFCSK